MTNLTWNFKLNAFIIYANYIIIYEMTQLFCFSLSTSLVVCSTAPEMKQLLSSAKFWPLLETWKKESLSFWLVVVYPSASEAIRKEANLTGRINLHSHVCYQFRVPRNLRIDIKALGALVAVVRSNRYMYVTSFSNIILHWGRFNKVEVDSKNTLQVTVL